MTPLVEPRLSSKMAWTELAAPDAIDATFQERLHLKFRKELAGERTAAWF